MNTDEKKELAEINEKARAAFRALSSQQKIQRLKDIGILDSNGCLSSRYGGDGEFTDPEPPPTTDE